MSLIQKPFRVLCLMGVAPGPAHRLEQALDRIPWERHDGPLAVVVGSAEEVSTWLLDALEAASQGRYDDADALVDRVGQLAMDGARVALGATDLGASGLELAVSFLLAPLRKVLLSASLLRERTPQTVDLVRSFGDRLGATVVTHVLRGRGVDAAVVDPRRWALSDDRFGDASIDLHASARCIQAEAERWQDVVTVHAGAVGQTADGRVTGFGHLGVQYTATALAAGLDAVDIVICGEDHGVRVTPEAHAGNTPTVGCLSFGEALELDALGARFLHPRALTPLLGTEARVFIRRVGDASAGGTRIDGCGEVGQAAIAALEGRALIEVRARAGASARASALVQRALAAVEEDGIATSWVQRAPRAAALLVTADAVPAAVAAIEAALEGALASGELEPVGVQTPVGVVSVVGAWLAASGEVAGRALLALAEAGEPVLAFGSGVGGRSFSVVVAQRGMGAAVRALQGAAEATRPRG